MTTPKPFKIRVEDAELELLRKKLETARLPRQPDGYTIGQGVPAEDMQRMVKHWREDFLPNWRTHEAALNKLPMFLTSIKTENFGTLNIHFLHQKSDVKSAIPLLFVHGWPGSFYEVVKLLPYLTKEDGESPAFHVVAPSLPNFGFSDEVKEVGLRESQE
jgi:pimeloyl-ACP methyl ester carboxylesterase